ncbi:MAG: flagellar basal body P-ring formation chaperone FlgA [Emcibacteraceae bacterium]|nr:flagellar basal body P-ring formation chaperone FlgA [Emcibacteraceae bacterium]
MIKKIFISVLLTCFIGPSLSAQEILPEIKASAIVDDSVVTLGDIFLGLAEKQDLVIANAPEPGQKNLIAARHVLKLTRANGVRWRNSAGVKNIVITRMSTVVTVRELKDAISDELKNHYLTSQGFDIRFYNQNAKIYLPNGYDAQDIEVKHLTIDKQGSKFSATVGAPTGSGSHTLHKINGRTMKVAMIPSLRDTTRNGSIINASDIQWVSVPESQIGRNIIRTSDHLIGMTPRTQIKEGMPIRLSEVNRPMLVKRGALVKIHFNTSAISLSTIGKAIENGGQGDVIQVKNNTSNKIITAVVLGENQVQVGNAASSLVLLQQ